MTLRIAAAVAVLAIGAALIAGLLATHHAQTGYVPAAKDTNLEAYQALMAQDYYTFNADTSNHCGTIADQGCARAVADLLPSMQKWVSDLAAFHTPAQLVVLDGRLRAHLTQAEAELNAAVAAQRTHDATEFTLAMNAALYERAWLDSTTFTLDGTNADTASSYTSAMTAARQSLDSCVGTSPVPDALACSHLFTQETCTGAAEQACAGDIEGAETQLQDFLIALAQHPASISLAGKDQTFQVAIARADDALLALVAAQLNNDAAKARTAEADYKSAISAADAIAGS